MSLAAATVVFTMAVVTVWVTVTAFVEFRAEPYWGRTAARFATLTVIGVAFSVLLTLVGVRSALAFFV